MASFIAIDVETSNESRYSICQIGLVEFADGIEVQRVCWLLDPATDFANSNIAVHGIRPEHVRNAPKLPNLFPQFMEFIGDKLLVSHTLFDHAALYSACDWAGLPFPDNKWVDSSAVARKAWPDVAQRGFGLKPLAARIGHEFQHHDAEADARACGLVLLAALTETGQPIEKYAKRPKPPKKLGMSKGEADRLNREFTSAKKGCFSIFVLSVFLPSVGIFGALSLL